MALSGNLKTMFFGDLLQWLSLGLKSGTLIVSRGQDEKRVYFREGRVIASASNNPREYLSEFLVASGRLGSDTIRKALEAQGKSKMLLGKILVMIDCISEKELIQLMRMKAEEEIYDLFLSQEGEFRFVDDELPESSLIPLAIDPSAVAIEGARRCDEWSRALQSVPRLDLVPVLENPVDHSAIPEIEGLIVQLVNGRRSIQDVINDAQANRFRVVTTMADLVRNGIISLYERGQAPPEAPAQALKTSQESPDEEVASMLVRAQALLKAGEFEKSLRMLRSAHDLDPSNMNVKSALKGAETVITTDLKRDGISLARVPQILKSLETITSIDFTPNEGFLLSRINGIWDVGSIIKISPMPESEALLILRRLRNDGIIEFV
jgi:hypothetical protein